MLSGTFDIGLIFIEMVTNAIRVPADSFDGKYVKFFSFRPTFDGYEIKNAMS